MNVLMDAYHQPMARAGAGELRIDTERVALAPKGIFAVRCKATGEVWVGLPFTWTRR